jgi:spermidine synthase
MPLLFLITAVSGFAALVYEILWIRQLSLVVGTTTAAISAVVAAFMGGLAIGSALLGRWADGQRRLLRVYAVLEVGIGLSALGVMTVLPLLPSAYPRIASAATSGTFLFAVRFVLVFGLLLVPTSLMGGTFPILVKAATREMRRLGGTASRLYAANTAGAVAGAFCAGLFLLGAVGVPGAYGVAIALNFLAALAALGLDRFVSTMNERPTAAAAQEGSQDVSTSQAVGAQGAPASDASRRVVFWAIGISGCFALGYEIVWSRALAVVLGHSIYAFTFVLSTYLGGIAIGGFLAAPLLDRARQPARLFAVGLALLAALAGVSLHIVPFLPFLEYEIGAAPLRYIAQNLACAGTILLLPTLLLGALLPLAVKVCASGLDRAGRDVGRVYAWNTVGSIAGSLLTGFVLIPWLGTQVSLGLLVFGNALLALAVGVKTGWRPAWSAVTSVAVVLSVVGLWAGRGSPIVRDKALARVEGFLRDKVELLFFGEDDVAAVGMVRQTDGLERLFADGVLMTHWGIETTFMAHLPLAIVPNPRDVLVLCLGMGNTYVSTAAYPVRVEVVELSRKVVEAFRFAHGKEGAASADRRITVGDARNTVLLASGPFDVITVDPPPPLYGAGTVNFHTTDFFRLCRAKTRPQGVVSVWIPFGQTTVDDFKILMKSFREVFEHTSVWMSSPNVGLSGVYMIGMRSEANPDGEEIRRRLSAPAVVADLRRFTPAPIEQLVPILVLVDADVDDFCSHARVMDDAHPYLEFPLFRNAGNRELMSFEPIFDWLKAHGRISPDP